MMVHFAWRILMRKLSYRPSARRPMLEALETRLVPTVPQVAFIARSVPLAAYTNASSISYSVVFNEPVSNVQAGDFHETTGPDLHVSGPVTVSGSGATYTVTVNGIHGSGDLRLDLIDNDTITDSSATPLGGVGLYNGSFQGQTYTITQALPRILSIDTIGPASTSSSSVDFAVTFNEPMASVNPTDFQLIATGTVAGTVTAVTAQTGTVYKVHVTGISGLGSLTLGLAKGNQIRDLHGNPLLPTASTPATSAFSLGLGYGVGLYPVSIVVADLTNNGIPDIVVANSQADSVSVLLGKGDGTFPTQETLSVGYGNNPVSIAVADVTGDGIPDIIVASQFGSITIFLGNGDGTFQTTPLTLNVGGNAASVVAGDFNGDGKTDLAIAFPQQNAIDVLLGNGDGTFQAPQQIPCGPAPDILETADLANNGVLDLVALNDSGDSVGVLMGKGNGTFAPEQVYPAGFGPVSLAIADLTGNGIPDIVVSGDISSNVPGVSVLMGNGDGTFQPAQGYATKAAGPLTVADLNGDGVPDVVVAEAASSNFIQWLYGNGDGTFGTPFQLSGLSGNPSAIAVADFNGDGIPDIVVAEVYNNLTLFMGNESSVATATFKIIPKLVLSPVSPVPASVVAGSTVSVQVKFEDPAGNPVTFADPVALYISGNSASPLATYVYQPSDQGSHTFTVALDLAGANQTFTAQDTTAQATPGSVGSLTVTPGPVSAFSLNGLSPEVGAGVGIAVTLTAVDSFGNAEPAFTGTVHFSSSDSHASLPKDYRFTASDAGVHMFPVTFETTGPQQMLEISDDAGIPTASASLTVVPGPPKGIKVTGFPSFSLLGKSGSFQVTIYDAFGNVDTTFVGSLQFSSSDGAASLPATYSTTYGGVFTFSATFHTPGMQTLTASDPLDGLSATETGIAVDTLSEVYVSQLYQDLLQRVVDASGLSNWSRPLEDGSMTRHDVAAILIGSTEYRGEEIANAYQSILRRPVDAPSLPYWLNYLNTGGTILGLDADLYGSNEFFQASGGTNTAFLGSLYQAILNRAADPAGSGWLNELSGGISRTAVAQAFLGTAEAESRLVQVASQNYLHQGLDANTLNGYVASLQSGASEEQFLANLVSSAAYAVAAGGNANQQYVSNLYIDLLGRQADPAGLTSFTSSLDSGTESRQQLVAAMLGSNEYRNQVVQGLYTTYLKRSADSAGLASFSSELAGGQTSEQIAVQLIASNEFFVNTGNSNLTFLQALYQDVLQRNGTEAEVAGWLSALKGGATRAAVTTAFFSSDEYNRLLVTNFYERYLHRLPDATGLAGFAAALDSGMTENSATIQILISAEYYSRFET